MSDRFRENTTVSKVAAETMAVFISLWLISFFFLSCGGSGGTGDAGGGSGADVTIELYASFTVNFPPVVFMADKDVDGTEIIKLSNDLDTGGNVVDFEVSPDGNWVAYVADQDIDEKFELFVVPVDKSDSESAQRISGLPMAGDGIKEITAGEYAFAWAPDSSRVAYLADQTIAGVIELYSNTPDGTSRTTRRLSVLGTGRDVEDFAWSPNLINNRLIAYRANQQTLDTIELYTTRPDATFSQKISNGVGFRSNVTAFKWAPEADRIAFIADKTTGRFELYTTSPINAFNVRVSGGLAGTSDVINFKWSPNSVRLAYLVELATPDFQLWTTPRDSLASIPISSDIKDDSESNYGWSSDNSRIAFIADRDTDDVFELYTSDPLASSPVTKVSGTLATGGDVTAFKWAPTELLIAYTADQDTNDIIELFTTNPPPAVTVIKVSGDPFAGVAVEDDFQWSPDSSLIAYRADQDTQDQIELYTTDEEGSDNDKVSGTLPSGGDVDEFKWDDDALEPSIGYLANQISVFVIELFASLPDGDENTRLSSDLVDENGDPEADGDVSAFEWVP